MIEIRGDRGVRAVVLAGILGVAFAVVSLVLRGANGPAKPTATAGGTTIAAAGGSQAAAPSAPDANAVQVEIKNFAFSPDPLEIAVGTTVTWTNADGFAHTATSQDAAAPFDTGKLETGRAASYRFETPGTFAYKCAIHNSMTGTIVVK